MMRYALTNQFFNEFLSLFPMIIPISHYVTPQSPRVFFTLGRIVASRCSIIIPCAAPRRHRYLGCIGTFPAMIALKRIQGFCIGFDQPKKIDKIVIIQFLFTLLWIIIHKDIFLFLYKYFR